MKFKLFAPKLNVIFGITTSSNLIINKIYALREVAYLSLINTKDFAQNNFFDFGDLGIYQAEVRHLNHAHILLIMWSFEVVIPKMTFKFGANNFNFIRVTTY